MINQVAHKTFRIFLWAGSLVILLLVLVQLALFAGIWWLNTEGGNRFVETNLQSALEGTGYDIAFTSFDYSFPTGLAIRDLEVSDDQGVFVEIDRVRGSVDLFPLAAKIAEISLSAGEVDLKRYPVSQEPEEPKEQEGIVIGSFELPDVYFNAFSISDLEIDRLILPPRDNGTRLVFSPMLQGAIDLGAGEIDGEVTIRPGDQNDLAWMPREFYSEFLFDTKEAFLTLSDLSVTSGVYDVAASGRLGFSQAQDIDLNIEGDIEELAAFAPDFPGRVSAQASISGTQLAPVIDAKGTLSSPKLEERGLSEIDATISSQNVRAAPQGDVSIETSYKGRALSLTSDYRLDLPQVALNNIMLTAPELSANGDINVNTDSLLADGTIMTEIQDLSAYADLIGQEIDARGQIVAELYAQNGNQAVDVNADVTNLGVSGVRVGALTAQTTIPNVRKPFPGESEVHVKNLNASGAEFQTLDLLISPAGNQNFRLSLKGQGEYRQPLRLDGTSTLKNVMAGTPQLDNLDMRIFVRDNALRLTGSVSQETIDMQARADELPLALLSGGDANDEDSALSGMTLSGEVGLSGPMSGPDGQAEISLSPYRLRDNMPEVNITAGARLQNGQLNVNVDGTGEGIEQLRGRAQMPVNLSLLPFEMNVDGQTPLQGQVDAALQTGPLATALLPPVHDFSGRVNAQAQISGTIGAPSYDGQLRLSEAQYFHEELGVNLNDITLEGQFQDGPSLYISNLSAFDGQGGSLSGSGQISLAGETAQSDFNLRMDRAYLLQGELADGRLSADLNLTGTGRDFTLGGTITTERMEINIPEQFDSNIPQLNIVNPEEERKKAKSKQQSPFNVALDMTFTANNQIFVRGWGLDAELGGELDINGTAQNPQVNGYLIAERGRYEEFGKRFTLAQARLRFQGSIPPSPYLDVVAETDAEDVTAQVNLIGSVADPEITFSSVPSLPEDEVLSRILFGANMSSISPFQAVQLARTLRRFTGQGGGGGLDPLATLRNATGFDDIQVETDEEGDPTVGVGKYLTDNVYLEFERGAGEGSGAANLEIELTPNITAESEVGQDARAGGGVFWEWDY